LFFEGRTMQLITTIENLITATIEQQGLKLYEVVLASERGEKYLRILIEKPQGRVSIDDIVKVTHLISPILDQANLPLAHYILDVTSAGDHPFPIQHIQNYLNRFVQVTLTHPIEGDNVFKGELIDVKDQTITLNIKIKNKIVPKTLLIENIMKAKVDIHQ
jgi:ribosome maturation factor RimP